MVLGKYEIQEELGQGGFGTVYKALDITLNRTVAVKVLHPNLVNDPSFLGRFRQEAQLAAQLDHANLVTVHDFGEFEGHFYIVMNYLPGGSLKELIKHEGALGKERSLKIFEQLCEGLSYAHGENIVHRDLKPGNILLDNRGNARISDLGFAKLLQSNTNASLSTSGGMVGTPAYMAPEIWRGKPATSATDVYSLACVLVEMLTGKALFGGESTPEIFAKIFEPLQLPKDLPGEWKPILETALEKNQEERIQTVGEFFEQIRTVELGLNEVEEVEPSKAGAEMTNELLQEEIDQLHKDLDPSFQEYDQLRKIVEPPPFSVKHKKYWWIISLPALILFLIAVNYDIYWIALISLALFIGGIGFLIVGFLKTLVMKKASKRYLELKPVVMPAREQLALKHKQVQIQEDREIHDFQSFEKDSIASTEISVEERRKFAEAGEVEKKSKSGLIFAGLLLLAIIVGVIIFQAGKNSAIPANIAPPATKNIEVSNSEVPIATKAATKTPLLKAPETVLGIGSTQIRDKDKMEQVYVPAGNFIMGSDDNDAVFDEKPVRTVYLNAYWIDKYEVSNGQYQECVARGACTKPHESKSWTRSNYYGDSSYDNYPVIYVDWYQAKAYCEWAGGDLPTEAQWEKAARGNEGREYPWGNHDHDKSYANYNRSIGDTTEVGNYEKGASPYGAMDMAGNVWEWVNDLYANEYDPTNINNPQGPDSGSVRVRRGGSWSDYFRFIRTEVREKNYPTYGYINIGFRCISSTATKDATKTSAPTATQTPAPSENEAVPGIGSIRIREMDGMEQVSVPAGNFIMGSDDSGADSDEKPVRKVYLDAYWIDKYEVNNGQYQECVARGACTKPQYSKSYTRSNYYGNSTYDDYPVIYVDWNQAKAYCEWAGGDLPTEAQWEKAARGVDARKYPWGNQEPNKSYANYDESIGDTTEVGRYEKGASPYGAMDMAGNVWEWVNDGYGSYDPNDTDNPKGNNNSNQKVVRGGRWYNNNWGIRTANRDRDNPNGGVNYIGFRCVSTP